MTSDILHYLERVVGNHILLPYIAVYLGIITIVTYMNYNEKLLITSINEFNYREILTKYTQVFALNRLIFGRIKDWYYRKHFSPKLKEIIFNELVKPVGCMSAEVLKEVKSFNRIFTGGINSLEKLVLNIALIVEPFIDIINAFFILRTKVSSNVTTINFGLIVIYFYLGLSILRFNYNNNKRFNRTRQYFNSVITKMWEIFHIRILNNRQEYTIGLISKYYMKVSDTGKSHEIFIDSLYAALDCLKCIISVGTVIYVKETNKVIEVFGFYWLIYELYGNTWQLFVKCRNILTSSDSWGSYEDFMHVYKACDASKILTNVNDLVTLSPVFNEFKEHNEIHLKGDSGSGKTTWIHNMIISIKMYYISGWIYLPQQSIFSNEFGTIFEIMTSSLPRSHNIAEDEIKIMLCSYAKKLGLDALINADTLDSKFHKPSGGEVTRITILIEFLPILLDLKEIILVFIDEISGLDVSSYHKVREVIEDLKLSKSIKFVTIEHQDLCKYGVKEVYIRKEIYRIERPKSTNLHDMKQFSTMFHQVRHWFGFDEKIIDENTENNTGIIVWIDQYETKPIKAVTNSSKNCMKL